MAPCGEAGGEAGQAGWGGQALWQTWDKQGGLSRGTKACFKNSSSQQGVVGS